MVALRDVGLEDDQRHDFSGSPWGTLGRVLPKREVTRDDVFIDFGCGMGHVLLEAASYDFRRIVGIEIAPEFVDVARATIGRNRHRLRCQEIDLEIADAVDYEVPDDVTVAYFSNPFETPTARAVIDNLLASVARRPRRVRVVYFKPPPDLQLEQSDQIRPVRFGRRRFRPWREADYLVLYEIAPGAGADERSLRPT